MKKQTAPRNSSMPLQHFSLLALRLVIASIFLLAAHGKWQYLAAGAPGLSSGMINLTYFLMIVEPLGAMALIFGFLTRWAAYGLAIIMSGSIIVLALTMGFPFMTQPQASGWDYNLLLLAGCIVLMAFGAGRLSLDAVRSRN